jgi:hypothetical protein
MNKGLIPGLTFVAALALVAAPAFAEEDKNVPADVEENVDQRDPNVIPFEEAPTHIFLTREEYEKANARQAFARPTPNMSYHGGKILPSTTTTAIFWGTSWNPNVGDKITGMDSWYSGFGGSNYAGTTTEYTGSNGRVGTGSTYLGHVIDLTAASGGGSTSAILAAVCRNITSPDLNGNGYYPVYTDLPRGNAGYCAWHSAGTCSGTLVQFAFFWKLDGDAGCDPQSTVSGESEGLAALANVSGHELAEAMTDPASPGAWYDSRGAENGDKCAWTFGGSSVTFSNGSQWKIQGEWSNAAYTAGTGYPNSSGQRGCLGGQ